MPEANDVLDGTEQVELPQPQRRRLRHGWNHVAIDPKHHARRFEPQEEIGE